MLFRKIGSLIEEHLKSDSPKVLLIDGARQVGKTYIIRHVGQKLFENYIFRYIVNHISTAFIKKMDLNLLFKFNI